jgi:hypothetical protein
MSGYTITDLNTTFTTLLQDGQAQFSITPLDFRTGFASTAGMIANTQTSSYTLVLTDFGKCVVMNSSSPINLTIPPNSSVAFQVGTVIPWYGRGTGLVTFVAGSGVTIEKSSTTLVTRAQGAFGGVWKLLTDTWVLWGDVT